MMMYLAYSRLCYLKCIIITQILNDEIKYSGFSFNETKNFQKSIHLEIMLGSPTQTLCDGLSLLHKLFKFLNLY